MPQDALDIPNYIRLRARALGLPEQFALGVADAESAFKPEAVGDEFDLGNGQRTRAYGLFQVTPETAMRYGGDPNDPARNLQLLQDPGQNVDIGLRYLKSLWDKYQGNPDLVLQAYGGVRTNPTYIPNVMARVLHYQQQGATERQSAAPFRDPTGLATNYDTEGRPYPPGFVGPKPQPGFTPPPRPFSVGDAWDAAKNTASVFWQNANPLPFLKTVGGMTPEDTGNMLASIGAQSLEQLKKAWAAAEQGHYTEAAGHTVGATPLIGPAAAEAGESFARGDTSTGVGQAAAVLAPFAATKVPLGRVGEAIKAVTPGAETADTLAAMAKRRIARVITPMTAREKLRWTETASDVAPRLAEEPGMGAWSRLGLSEKVTDRFARAQAALDEAHDARLSARTFETQPLIDALLERRRQLEMQPVDASQFPPPGGGSRITAAQQDAGFGASTQTIGRPIGEPVVPMPTNARVAMIDQAIDELRRLGRYTRYDELRLMRKAYDGPASITYNPSLTQDFLKAQGGALGAADVTGALRDFLGIQEPSIVPANAEYSFWRAAHDVLAVTEETQQARPATLRRIFGGIGGGGFGYMLGGWPGMAAGVGLGGLIEDLTASGYTIKIQSARLMSELANALRQGDTTRAAALTAALQSQAQQAKLTGMPPPNPNAHDIELPKDR